MSKNEWEWSEFFERFVINFEEFLFYYKNKKVNISTSGYKTGKVYLSYGNEADGFILKDYKSPYEFLEDKIFDGKSFVQIWDELE